MSFEKIVKLACKPKAAPPKSKYMDPIIAATYDEEGAVSDVCRAISTRLREPNAIVVFKALIVVHTMLRHGATENVLGYMAKFDPLRLHNVGQGHWDGYRAPENLAQYASYLESRIKAFRDLKHDAIRVQSESNRDHRVSLIEEGGSYFPSSGVSRSKTIVGRKLRVMTVEKGLLRETKIVQGMIDALVECRFYLDDLEDQLNITSLRMLVKDLLTLFQACNEGVINVLENYFEMSHVDAETALGVYQRFCRQTEKVVDYLSVAKKLQNLLNVPIPNLKHAPVSLVNALEEYLRDPNFEQNRLEYKANKAAADGKPPPNRGATRLSDKAVPSTSPPPSSTAPPMPSKVEDFFASIETEQSHMFNSGAESPTTNYFSQQAAFNPFVQRQSSLPLQMTGFPLGNGTVPVLSSQPPEFAQPPFGPIISVTPTGMPQQTGFLQPVPRSNTLQPQTTGSNPFRQSILLPQHTGMQAFGGSSSGSNPFPRPASSMGLSAFGGERVGSPSFTTSSNTLFGGANQGLTSGAPVGSDINGKVNLVSSISRPASTPIRSTTMPVSTAQPIKSHQTGSRNPFGQPLPPPVPPVPKSPTLQQLATGAGWGSSFGTNNQGAPATGPLAPQPTSSTSSGVFSGVNSQQTNAGLISSIASSFGTGQNDTSGTLLQPNSSRSPPPADANNGNLFPSLHVQPTPSTNVPRPSFGTSLASPPASTVPTSSLPTGSVSLQPQPTGFGGSSVRPFKPSSSFGASLMEKLPPIPSEPGTPMLSSSTNGAALPNVTGMGNSSTLSSTNTSTTQTLPSGPLISNPTGLPNFGSSLSPGNGATVRDLSPLGVGLRPQPAGGTLGGANPFRASMAAAGGTGGTNFSGLGGLSNTPVSGFSSAFGSSALNNRALNSTATGIPQLPSSFTGMEAFGSQFNNLGVGGGLAQNGPGRAPLNHQQQSLI